MTDPRWQPPSPAELDELDAFLAGAPDAMPLPEAHGLLTAIVSAPTVVEPGTWQAMLLGDARFESQPQAQRIVGLIMRLYNQILSELDAGELITLPDVDNEQACSAWCRGYLAGTRLDDHWATDESAVMMMLPFGALSGEFDLTGEEDDAGNVIEDPTPHLAKFRTNLAAYVVALFDYWKQRRQRPAPPRSARKIGRNEPCPCGSGLKYKRCCGAAVH